MNAIRDNIQKNLVRYLTQNRMSQNQLAKMLHITGAAVNLWVKGNCTPDIESIIGICEVFHISADELFGLEKGDGYTAEEKLLISQYRAHPEFKQAVNRLLGLDKIYERQIESGKDRRIVKDGEPER